MTSNHRALEDTDIELIERVKLTPSLYDPRNPNFRLTGKKEKDWENVASPLAMTAADARRRWTCLRDRYSRELKQLRLNPGKGEFGKNEFFRLMDFLRRFVRKRRERRRYAFKYENSWDGGSMDDTSRLVQIVKLTQSEGEEIEERIDEDQPHVYEEEVEQHNYHSKREPNPTVECPEFVEVDTAETYEDYVEHPTTESNSSNSAKPITSSSLIPVLLESASTGTYSLSTQQRQQQQQNIPQLIQMPHQTTHQHHLQPLSSLPSPPTLPMPQTESTTTETEDDYFCKSIGAYLRQLSRRHKIKAKVEMFQILEKYIELEESHGKTNDNNTAK